MSAFDDIAVLASDLKARRPDYERYRAYYDGKQEIRFAGEKLQTAFGKELSELVCNRVAPAVDAIADRLQITGWTVVGGAQDEDAERIWAVNGMAKGHGEVHVEALTSGDAYLLVWPDARGQARMWPQPAKSIAIAYDDEHPGEVRVAAKAWRLSDKRWRLNLYYRDRLEKYITTTKSFGNEIPVEPKQFEPYPDEDPAWPVMYDPAWSGTVPLFHFANNGRTGEYGKSEVAALISLQDRLNMTLANLAIAEEFQSYRQRWAVGVQPILDPETGKPINPFTAGAGQLWLAANEAARFGDFEAADLEQFGKTAEGHEVRIARTARIPLFHLLQAGAPESGEALRTAEEPFVAKVRDRQREFGPVWERAMALALRMEGIDEADVRVNWLRAESRNEREFWELAVIKREMGVSPQQILREYGYTEQQIAEFLDEIAEFQQATGTAAAQAFNAGIALVAADSRGEGAGD